MYGKKSVTLEFKGLDIPNSISNKFLENVDRAMQQAMQTSANDLRASLKESVGTFGGEIGWTGYLYNSIEAYNEGNLYLGGRKEWIVRMLDYGNELDHAPPHTEWLTKGRKITTWAKAHDIKAKELVVKPHPFIQRAKDKLDNNVQLALREHGLK